jgi:hypothetical protein
MSVVTRAGVPDSRRDRRTGGVRITSPAAGRPRRDGTTANRLFDPETVSAADSNPRLATLDSPATAGVLTLAIGTLNGPDRIDPRGVAAPQNVSVRRDSAASVSGLSGSSIRETLSGSASGDSGSSSAAAAAPSSSVSGSGMRAKLGLYTKLEDVSEASTSSASLRYLERM